jgi:hypothetical protein
LQNPLSLASALLVAPTLAPLSAVEVDMMAQAQDNKVEGRVARTAEEHTVAWELSPENLAEESELNMLLEEVIVGRK